MTDAWLESLPVDDCLALLRANVVGRVAFVVDDIPVILPVNYRLAEGGDRTSLVLRARSGGIIDRSMQVAFEIDGIDAARRRGWSVLVRGSLSRAHEDVLERVDPEPWIEADRDAWLVIEPLSISGRILHAAELNWAFHVSAYL